MYGARMATNAKRISNRKRQKIAQLAIDHAINVRMILLAVLAQSGGEITVTDGTLAQVARMRDVDYAIVDGATPNEHIVRLIGGSSSGTGTARDGDQRIGTATGELAAGVDDRDSAAGSPASAADAVVE